MNDFRADDGWQRRMRDRFIVPYYERVLCGGYQLLDDRPDLQRRGVDTLLDGSKYVLWIDEKIVRWPGYKYDAFALETDSCTLAGYEKTGWMVYSEADWLLYCFEQKICSVLDCWWINFQSLKGWFGHVRDAYPEFQMETLNKTKGRVVLIEDVRTNVPCRNFQLCG